MTDLLSRTLLADLRTVVGDAAVISDPERLLVYESDGLTAYRFPPLAVVLPADSGEVSAVLRRLARERVPVVPRGAGTGLSGGALAVGGAVIVGTARMNRIVSLDPESRLARVQPGVVNAELSAAARPHGLYYAPDPSSQSACTLGGNVAENSGGPHCLKYGVTSRYVTALTAVLRDGEVVELGGAAREGTGYDLVGVLVGSEGCLAVVTEIEVRLLPLPEGVRTLLAIFDRIQDAGHAVTDIIASGLLPAALEIVDRETIRAVEASVFAAGYPVDAGAALVVEFDGTTAGLDEEAARAEAACLSRGAREVRRARTEAERAALWKGRKKAFGAMGRIAPDLLVQDATVPRTRLPDVLARIEEIASRHRLSVANVFHAGDGNLHPNLLFDRRDPAAVARVEAASREIMQACVDAGGTITGEHGVGLDKRAYMPLVHSPEELSAMAGVKAVFDPAGLLNPGKVLPDGVHPPEPGLLRRGASPPAAAPGGAADPEHVERVRAAFESLLGEGSVERPLDGRRRVGGREPCAVLLPGCEEEVAACLRVASERGWRVVPAGAGTWLDAGGPVPQVDAVLAVTRLDRIVQYEPADLTVTAGAGLSLAGLDGRLAAEGQWLPLDPPGHRAGTLGATLATASAGGLSAAYGAPRDLVLGLRVVTGDGRRLRLGGRVVKNVAGFDLVRLVVGSWGTLGVVTEASLRLFPRSSRRLSLIARGESLEELVDGARRVAGTRIVPAAVELLERPDPDRPGRSEAALLVRLAGQPERVEREAALLRERLEPVAVVVAEGEGEDEVEPLLRGIRGLDEGAEMAFRMTLPPGGLPDLVAIARSAGRLVPGKDELENGPHRVAVDAQGGALRLAITRVRADPPWADAWGKRLRELRRTLELRGGGLVLHRAPVAVAEASRERGGSGASRLMAGIKEQFDPAGILSAGRWVVPDG